MTKRSAGIEAYAVSMLDGETSGRWRLEIVGMADTTNRYEKTLRLRALLTAGGRM